jgi:uncharacterized damage-inducible protein DinB
VLPKFERKSRGRPLHNVQMPDVDHEPNRELPDPKELFLGYLDYYRSVIVRKLQGLDESELRGSRFPSGWTPLELLKHLIYMEARWLRWGFDAEQVASPWGDHDEAERWHVSPDETFEELVSALNKGGVRTREIVEGAELRDVAAAGGRFSEDEARPTLAWILFHVLQEYARHAGHMDIARELADGVTGE